MTRITGILTMMLGVFCVLPTVKADKRADYPSYALLVGSTQPGKDQAPLRYSHDDVSSLRSVLADLGGLPSENIITLLDPKPDQLYRALDRLQAQLEEHALEDEDAAFFFYYSGHARSQTLSLGTEEIPLGTLRNRFKNLRATVKLIIFDACQAGSISRIKGVEPTALFSYNSVAGLNMTGMAVMSSSSASELSQESDTLGGSFFTHHLVVGLRGAADANRDGRITLNEAYQYAYNNTLVDTTGTAIGKQHVTLETEMRGKGDLILTWPERASSRLLFPSPLSAEILVFTFPERSVVAEVHKASGNAVTLALPIREYGALVREDQKTQYCKIERQNTNSRELVISNCEEMTIERIQFKGKNLEMQGQSESTTDGRESAPLIGPKKFYINIGAGIGYGYLNADLSATREVSPEEPGANAQPPTNLVEIKDPVNGSAWSGVPIKLTVGVFLTQRFAVELSGRFDMHITSLEEPVSCWEANGESLEGIEDVNCSVDLPVSGENYTQEEQEQFAKHSVALSEKDGTSITKEETQFAWLVNARTRFQFFTRNKLKISIFAGLGYGHIKYKISSKSMTDYFVPVGVVDIELGPQFAFYFTDYFGIHVELPFYLVFGEGFAFNAEAILGAGFGF